MIKTYSSIRRGKHRSKAPKPSFKTHTISKTFKRVDRIRRVLPTGLKWFAVQTNPKCEKRAGEKLVKLGVEVFRPEYTEARYLKRSRRKVDHKRHFFPRYIFVGLDPKRLGFEIVRSADGVERIIDIQGWPVPIKVETLQWVADVLTGHAEDIVEQEDDPPFRKGEQVLVKDGPFASFNAVVEHVMSNDRVKALVAVFGRASVVEFKLEQLETLEAA